MHRLVLGLVVMFTAAIGIGCESQQTTLVASDRYPTLPYSTGQFKLTDGTAMRPKVLAGGNTFSVAVDEKIKGGAETQNRVDSCWAACAVALLRHDGAEVKQTDLLRKYGEGTADELKLLMAMAPESQGAQEVERALRETSTQNYNGPSVRMASHTATSDDLIEALWLNRPVVVGLKLVQDTGSNESSSEGHLRVITGAEFAEIDPAAGAVFLVPSSGSSASREKSKVYAKYAIRKLHYFDPIPGRGFGEMTGVEAENQINFIATRVMADQILRDTHDEWQYDRQNQGKPIQLFGSGGIFSGKRR